MNPEELKNFSVLKHIDAEVLTRLAEVLESRNYAETQAVFAEGDAGDSMYFIVSGRIRIEKRVQSGGPSKVLAVLQEGEYFGEMALLDQKPRSAAAVAAGNTTVLRLSKAAFDSIQRENTAVGLGVLFAMIRTSSERIRRLSSHLVAYDEVGKAIGEARDLQQLLDVLLQQLTAAVNADWGLLLLRCQFSESLELRGQVNLPLKSTQTEAIRQGAGFLGAVLKNPHDEVIGCFEDHEPFKSCTRLGFETDSLLLSPITLEGRLLGLIALGGNERDQFDLNALNLARGIACQAAQAILNARRREEEQAMSRHSKQYVRF